MPKKRKSDQKLPEKFMLGGSVWTVSVVPHMSEMGSCDPMDNRILIRKGMPEQATVQTFFHELVHAINFTLGKQEHDERQIDAFAHLLHQYMVTVQ